MRQARLYALRAGALDLPGWYAINVDNDHTGRILNGWYIDDPSPTDDLQVQLPLYGNYTKEFAQLVGAFGFVQNFTEDPTVIVYAKKSYDASTIDGKRIWTFNCKRYRGPITIQVPFGTPFITGTPTAGDL